MLKDLPRILKEWLYPPLPQCIWCGNVYWPEGRLPFCGDCIHKISLVTGPQCGKCGRPLRLDSVAEGSCYLCRREKFYFTTLRSAVIYDGLIKELLYRLKYYGQAHLGEKLGEMLVERIKWEWFWFLHDLILPIPISIGKEKQRGYNQAGLLALPVARYLRKPCREDVLIRVKETLSQNELTLSARKKNLSSAFVVANPGLVAGKNILLIDDIFTSGATLSSAAEVLLKNGALRVDALTLAAGVTPRQWFTKKNF